MKYGSIRIVILLCLLPLQGRSAVPPPWGKTGHRVVGEVAQQYLTQRAQKSVSDLLGGETLAEVANYGDDIKSDPRYRKYTPWHYVNFEPDKRYGEDPPNPDGDLIEGIRHCMAVLEDPKSTREDRVFHLKLLIHFIGDLHQPMHLGREGDKGGNDIQVQWFGRGSNLHRVWDSDMIDAYGMSYTELSETLPRWSRKKKRQIQEGSLMDWVGETHRITHDIYASVEVGDKLSYPYSYRWWEAVEEQLLKGGLRLAAVLNAIFD